MFQFEKISVSQILVLSEIINESSLLQKEFIKSRYLRSALNFDEIFEFLRELNLIEERSGQIILKPKYRNLLKDIREAEKPKEILKNFIVNYLINEKTPFSEHLKEFLIQFRLINNQYEFTPSAFERLKYSGIRNFLIDLEFLYLDSTETKYVIAEDCSLVCAKLKRSYQISLDEFIKIQKMREEIGKAAEIKIVEYEKERLSKFPHLCEKIEHTALKNVAAGYDIKSFDVKLNDNSATFPRFIEVKAVSPRDYGFEWTRNELEKSKLYRQNYYLYLLPVTGKNKFDLASLKVIKDPYLNVYKDKDKWTCTSELLAFSISKNSSK